MNRLTALLLLAASLTAAPAADDAASKRPKEGAGPAAIAPARERAAATDAVNAERPQPERQLFSGEVVFLHDALKERGIKSYDEELKGQVVLKCDDGELIPILPDWRGRAFYQDERLRDRPVELVAHRRVDVGYLQVLMVFTFDDQGAEQFTDYWCDICAIPMYELKPCECCQGEIRLRHQAQKPPADVAPYPGQKHSGQKRVSGE
jgi:hypothetical protein